MKFEIGQIVVISHQPRHHIPPTTCEGIVKKVGRKYVTVGVGHAEWQFDITTSDEKAEFSPTHCVWESMQQFNDAQESKLLQKETLSRMQDTRLNLQHLREIQAILDQYEDEE